MKIMMAAAMLIFSLGLSFSSGGTVDVAGRAHTSSIGDMQLADRAHTS